MRYTAAIALFVILCRTEAGNADSDSVYPDRPVSVRVTGTLLPVEGQDREDIITVPIFVQGQPWLLRIGKVEELTASEKAQAVRQDVLLRQVRFSGPEELVGTRQKPDVAGKVFTIEGRLDTREKRFLVTGVDRQSPVNPPHSLRRGACAPLFLFFYPSAAERSSARVVNFSRGLPRCLPASTSTRSMFFQPPKVT